MAGFHDKFTEPLRVLVNFDSTPVLVWLLLLAGVMVALGLIFRRFFTQFPARVNRLFVLAFLLSFTSTVGMEVVARYRVLGDSYAIYAQLGLLEETLEMFGVLVFIYALQFCVTEPFVALQVVLGQPDSTETAQQA
jgi:hypothetical protein